jgi:hypothetical protein
VLRFVRELLPRHPLEQQLNIEAEALMDAISRADELIMRNIRGVIAEAAFGFYVLGNPGSPYVTLSLSLMMMPSPTMSLAMPASAYACKSSYNAQKSVNLKCLAMATMP